MESIINEIIENNKEIFGINAYIEKVNIGFTNIIYMVDNKYVVKICSKVSNEEDFVKEIEFYRSNEGNELIPKLYSYDISKKIVPYYYEIIEKIDGVSLYSVWHLLEEDERKDIIRQLCSIMKIFHSKVGKTYDWNNYIKEQFDMGYNKAKDLNLFSNEENDLIHLAYKKFDEYLDSDKFVLVHNDLHFDNVFYNDKKIKLIDFERSMIAPIDFELDIFYRMVRMPWKFAGDDTWKLTKVEDYEHIMDYVKEFYPELVSSPYLYKRLAIYDMVYFMDQYVDNPKEIELKEAIMNGVRLVID